MQDKELTAIDYQILKKFHSTDLRMTQYKIGLLTGLDDNTLTERLEKLEQLGYMKHHSRYGTKIWRRL